MAVIAQRLAGFRHAGSAPGTIGIGRGLAHPVDQRGLELCGAAEPLLRMTFDGDVDKDGDLHVVAGDPERLEIGQCLVQHCRSSR